MHRYDPAVHAAEALAKTLAASGVTRVFSAGETVFPSGGPRVVPIAEAAVASLLADADGRIGPGPGAAWLPGRLLRLSSRPGGTARPVRIADPGQMAEGVAAAAAEAGGPVPATRALILDLDLGDPCDPAEPGPLTVAPSESQGHIPLPLRVALLVGPGVIRSGRSGALQRLAAAASVGVANTWGAKGQFAWDSPFHMGTAGLQTEDFRLLGFADLDLIVATGLDPDESPRERWALTDTLELDMAALGLMDRHWGRNERPIPPNLLYQRLAEVVQRLSPSAAQPLSPARAVADLRVALPEGGLVAADPGMAGLWVARTFPTTEAGSVVVPATVAPGFAAAAALVCALSNRPAIAVTQTPIDNMTNAVLEAARALGAPLVIEGWHDGPGGSGDHDVMLRGALRQRQPTMVDVAVNGAHTAQLVDVAGPVVAWTPQ